MLWREGPVLRVVGLFDGDMNKRVNCHQCRHYYVTWDTKAPYGCRAMNFKSKMLPSLVVFRSSGMKCMAFEPKSRET